MTATRAVLVAVLLVLLLPLIGVGFLYAYRAQGPADPAAAPMIGFGVLPLLVLWLIPIAVIFLVVYAAVRLAIRHERGSGTKR